MYDNSNWLRRDSGTPSVYYGYSSNYNALDTDSTWTIKKFTTSGTVDTVLCSNGSSTLGISKWSDRSYVFNPPSQSINVTYNIWQSIPSLYNIDIEWNNIPGVDRYQILIQDTLGNYYDSTGNINCNANISVNSNSYVYQYGNNGTDYVVTVKGINVAGSTSSSVNILIGNATTTTTSTTTTTTTTQLSKLSLYHTSDSTVVYNSNDLSDMIDYMSNTYDFPVPTTLQFNTSDTYALTTTLIIAFNNNNNLLTIKSLSGQNPILDVQILQPTVMQIGMNDVVVDGLTLKNADPTNDNGCVVRADATTNVTLRNITFQRGYCAVRATTNVYDLTIDSCIVKEVVDGSFRLGNGLLSGIDGLWDMQNVTVSNISFVDNLNGANIPGTSTPFSPYLLLKKSNGLLVENLIYNQPIYSGIGTLEECGNIVFKNVVADGTVSDGLYIFNTNGLNISNYFFRGTGTGSAAQVLYATNTFGITLNNNTLLQAQENDVTCNLYLCGNIIDISGNILQGNQISPCLQIQYQNTGYTASISTDLGTFDYNLYTQDNAGDPEITIQNLSDFNGGGYTKIFTYGSYTIPVWQTTYNRDIHSSFDVNGTIQFGSDNRYLGATSIGRNIVTSKIGSLTTDALGHTRTYPSDPGALDSNSK